MWTLCGLLVASPQTPGEKILRIFSAISQHICVKGRIVPIGERVTNDLRDYQRARGDAHEKFFLTKNFAPITNGCVHSLMRRLKKRTGITRIHAHLFRHTFATNFLVHGLGDVYELSRLLGHGEIKTTEKYLQLASYYTIMQKRKKLSYLDFKEKNQQE